MFTFQILQTIFLFIHTSRKIVFSTTIWYGVESFSASDMLYIHFYWTGTWLVAHLPLFAVLPTKVILGWVYLSSEFILWIWLWQSWSVADLKIKHTKILLLNLEDMISKSGTDSSMYLANGQLHIKIM